jgi:hypothetical protein
VGFFLKKEKNVCSNVANLSPLQKAVQAYGACSTIKGAPASDDCMLSQVVSQISFVVPGCNNGLGGRSASLSTSQVLPLRLQSASVNFSDEIRGTTFMFCFVFAYIL